MSILAQPKGGLGSGKLKNKEKDGYSKNKENKQKLDEIKNILKVNFRG